MSPSVKQSGSLQILVVAKPGLLRTSLVAVLTSAPEVDVITEVDNLRLALSILEQQHPDLILVVDNLNDEDWLALRQIKLQFPRTRRVVFVDDVKQKQALNRRARKRYCSRARRRAICSRRWSACQPICPISYIPAKSSS